MEAALFQQFPRQPSEPVRGARHPTHEMFPNRTDNSTKESLVADVEAESEERPKLGFGAGFRGADERRRDESNAFQRQRRYYDGRRAHSRPEDTSHHCCTTTYAPRYYREWRRGRGWPGPPKRCSRGRDWNCGRCYGHGHRPTQAQAPASARYLANPQYSLRYGSRREYVEESVDYTERSPRHRAARTKHPYGPERRLRVCEHCPSHGDLYWSRGDRIDRWDKTERAVRRDQSERNRRADRDDWYEKGEKGERGERGERHDRTERIDQSGWRAWAEWGERRERKSRSDRESRDGRSHYWGGWGDAGVRDVSRDGEGKGNEVTSSENERTAGCNDA